MVRVALQISANLENIEEIKTCHPDYAYFIKIVCTNCGGTSDRWHDISESSRTNQDTRNSKGFNFVMKCKMCGRENSIDIVEKSNVAYNQKNNNQFQTIVIFDCRGAEPVEFSPRSGWIVQSADGGQKFEDVDLSENEWVDYDEKNSQSVGVYEIASKFIKLKK